MEVMIATALLSVVLLTLIQSGENSIYFLEKSKKTEQNKQYLQIALDTNSYKKRNENIYLEKEYNNLDDEVRLELKKAKVKIKEDLISKENINLNDFSFVLNKVKAEYIVNEKIKKDIYKIKIEF